MGTGIVSGTMIYKEAWPDFEGRAWVLREKMVNIGAGGGRGGCRDLAQPLYCEDYWGKGKTEMLIGGSVRCYTVLNCDNLQ